jgi:hypothetical protein
MKLCCLQENGSGDHHVEGDKPNLKNQISCFHSYVEFRSKIAIIAIIIKDYMHKRGLSGGRISEN